MTIRDIAKVVGVSPATVSRVLSKDPAFSVADSTREKILATASEMGYYVKQNKKGSRPKSITCMVQSFSDRFEDSYYAIIINAMIEELKLHNYSTNVLFLDSITGVNNATLLDRVGQHDGTVLFASLSESMLSAIQSTNKPVICVDTNLNCFDNIRYNRFEAGAKAMQYLIENGHQRIAFIGSRFPFSFSFQFGRFDAYKMVMKKYHLRINEQWIIDCGWKRDVCFEKTQELMRMKDSPTAIFASSDHMAIASAGGLIQDKHSIPDDISLIGISDIPEAKYLNPPLTTVSIPKVEMGQLAANTIIARINGDTSPPKQIYLPSELIIRKSVRKLK